MSDRLYTKPVPHPTPPSEGDIDFRYEIGDAAFRLNEGRELKPFTVENTLTYLVVADRDLENEILMRMVLLPELQSLPIETLETCYAQAGNLLKADLLSHLKNSGYLSAATIEYPRHVIMNLFNTKLNSVLQSELCGANQTSS